MKFIGLWLVLAVIVLALGGILVYRSTAPEGDVVPEGESSLEEAPNKGTSNNSQFLQMRPDSLPPGEEEVDGEAEGGSSAGESPKAQAARDGETGEEFVVSVTDVGFVPDNITVGAGDMVTFTNNGQALHWPASDLHPTHELLPGFDAGRALATGEDYSFTFDEVGTWTFHDHLNPQLTGKIIVE